MPRRWTIINSPAFLFASPFTIRIGAKTKNIDPISFSEEFEKIKQAIELKEIEFNYRYELATTSNLERTLTENPVGLHFSGHGYVNDKDFYLGEGREFSAHG